MVHTLLNDAHLIYGMKMTKYMEEKTEKANMHWVKITGTAQHIYEILCIDKGRRRGKLERFIQECTIFVDRSICTYYKPTLLQKSCSHMIAMCDVTVMRTQRYVSDYFKKEALFDTWNHEIYSFRIYGSFTRNLGPMLCSYRIPTRWSIRRDSAGLRGSLMTWMKQKLDVTWNGEASATK